MYLLPHLNLFLASPLGSLLLGILDPLLLSLVESRQIFMARIVVETDFFDGGCRFSLLRRRR